MIQSSQRSDRKLIQLKQNDFCLTRTHQEERPAGPRGRAGSATQNRSILPVSSSAPWCWVGVSVSVVSLLWSSVAPPSPLRACQWGCFVCQRARPPEGGGCGLQRPPEARPPAQRSAAQTGLPQSPPGARRPAQAEPGLPQRTGPGHVGVSPGGGRRQGTEERMNERKRDRERERKKV